MPVHLVDIPGMPRPGLELARGRVPESDAAVTPSRRQPPAVGAEQGAVDVPGVRTQTHDVPARGCVPEHDRAIVAADSGAIALRTWHHSPERLLQHLAAAAHHLKYPARLDTRAGQCFSAGRVP